MTQTLQTRSHFLLLHKKLAALPPRAFTRRPFNINLMRTHLFQPLRKDGQATRFKCRQPPQKTSSAISLAISLVALACTLPRVDAAWLIFVTSSGDANHSVTCTINKHKEAQTVRTSAAHMADAAGLRARLDGKLQVQSLLQGAIAPLRRFSWGLD